MNPPVEVEYAGAVAQVFLNRPERGNTVTAAMAALLYSSLDVLRTREDVHVVVVSGRGSAFCLGADLQMPVDEPSQTFDPQAFHIATTLVQMPQVTVALINGSCAGAGLAWASACDLRFASAGARFSTALLQVGVSSEYGLAWTLQRNLSAASARDLLFLPEKFDAERALRLGLVSRVFPDSEFAKAGEALVQELASRNPQGLRSMKADCIASETLPLSQYIEFESRLQMEHFSGAALAESQGRFAARLGQLHEG